MDLLVELQEKYAKVRKLIEEESKNDPESEPYRSKYKAKHLLSEMKSQLSDKLDAVSSCESENRRHTAMLSVVLLHLGIISLDTEELSTGEELLTKCLETIPDHLHPDFILVSLNARNQLGILWSQRSQPENAKTYLEGCEHMYEDYMKLTPSQTPKNIHELFDTGEGMLDTPGELEIEKVHTLTKFFLAQVYGTLRELLKSGIYCHETLHRQLEYKEYDSIDWALNSATLSQFFMERLLFTQARHHLAAASYILDKYEDTLKQLEGTEEELEAKKEEFRHRSADVARCWAKYGIFILEHSKNRLAEEEEVSVDVDDRLKNLWFASLEVANYENQITDTPVLVFDEARDVFLNVQKNLNSAKEYYCLEDHASEHVQVVQDHSQVFKHLAAFEMDDERQCKMTKKRIDMLETVLKELNPQFYLLVCRQLWFELGECYHDIMNVKYHKIKDSNNVPTAHALRKINNLAEESIANFNHFLQSLKSKGADYPDPLPEDLIRPTLIAYFYMGWLYHKMITQDNARQMENTVKALECYKYMVEYCKRHENAHKCVVQELGVSKDMVTLLELKLIKLGGTQHV